MSIDKPHHAVVAGVLMNASGEVLLATRPLGRSFVGYWEFPGGKIEAGESAFAALVREWQEETALTIHHAHPWLTLRHDRADVRITLQFWRINAQQWSGTPTAREGQRFAWQAPDTATVTPMLAGNDAILRALTVPTRLYGNINDGLCDAAGIWHALPPTRQHRAEHAALLLHSDELDHTPISSPFWLVVEHPAQFWRGQDAAAVLWLGDTATLLDILREGVFLPILAPYENPTQANVLHQAGIHGFIDFNPTTKSV